MKSAFTVSAITAGLLFFAGTKAQAQDGGFFFEPGVTYEQGDMTVITLS